ncbi:MAG: flavodoxin family protein, partial [Thermoplasmata archaeon]
MKICIAYFSKYGNGKKCVEHLQGNFKKRGTKAELYSILEVKPDSLPEADVYIFSSPTRMIGIPGKMKRFVKKMKLPQEGARYAVINTFSDESRVLERMDTILKTKGMVKASEGLSIKVLG